MGGVLDFGLATFTASIGSVGQRHPVPAGCFAFWAKSTASLLRLQSEFRYIFAASLDGHGAVFASQNPQQALVPMDMLCESATPRPSISGARVAGRYTRPPSLSGLVGGCDWLP